MKKTIEIEKCKDCKYSRFIAGTREDKNGFLFKRCLKNGRFIGSGWDTIPNWCPLPDSLIDPYNLIKED